ncbi:ABC transporter permease [Thalassoroseus pseudoceratinae]|uniref:ABC transporter permease n=1 Tax=Thalassoroseus pseudoceratinae TaxID=2713176 RepID=UPI00141E6689|nr:ABC transporter permease [Thalassoroseus pseudoceratinae]
MNESALAIRLLWKELRTQTSFFVSVTVSSAAFLVLFKVLSTRTETSDWAMIVIAMTMPCLYALGAAGTAFAGEREEGTDKFLRLRGVPHLPVWTSKFLFLLVSMLLMSGLLWAIAGALGTNTVAETFYRYLLRGVCLSIQLLAWGILASMLASTALTAVVLGVSATFATWTFLTIVSPEVFSPIHYFLTIGLVAIDIVMVDVWLRTEPGRVSGWWRQVEASRPKVDRRRKWRWRTTEVANPARRIWQRLCWHERQESRFLFVAVGFQFCLSLLALIGPRDLFEFCTVVMMFLLIYTPFHSGLKVFQAEQRQARFRFFNDRGVSAGWIWISKQYVWMTRTLIATALLYGAVYIVMTSRSQTEGGPESLITGGYLPGGIVIWTLLAYGIGQLCSLLFSRGVVAWFMALVFAATAAFIWQEVAFLHGSMMFVAAIWLATLIISYVRTGDWLSEQTGRVARLRLTGAVVIPFGVLATIWAISRVQTIPAIATQPLQAGWFPVQNSTNRAIDDTLRTAQDDLLQHENFRDFQHVHAIDGLPPTWASLTWEQQSFVTDNQSVIKKLITALDESSSSLAPSTRFETATVSEVNLRVIRTLLCCDARRLEADRELNTAFDRYLTVLKIARLRARGQTWRQWRESNLRQTHLLRWLPGWVMAAGQRSTRVRQALVRLVEEWNKFPTAALALNNTVRVQWHELSAWTALRNWPIAKVPSRYDGSRFLGDIRGKVYLQMPFEQARAERILLCRYARLFDRLTHESHWRAYGTNATGSLISLQADSSEMADVSSQTIEAWLASSPMADDFPVPGSEDILRQVTDREMAFRMAIIGCWLTDAARETGDYPRTLVEVAEQLPPDLTPGDPWYWDDFLYFPDGMQQASLMRNNRLWVDYSDPPLIAGRGFKLPMSGQSDQVGSITSSGMQEVEGVGVTVVVPLWPDNEAPGAIALPPLADHANSF